MCILINPLQGGEWCQFTVTTILMASGGRPDRDPLAPGSLAVPGVFHDRGHLVTLHPRVKVAGSGERAHLSGEHMEVGAADTHPFGSHDDVTRPGAARSGNVLDHHLAG